MQIVYKEMWAFYIRKRVMGWQFGILRRTPGSGVGDENLLWALSANRWKRSKGSIFSIWLFPEDKNYSPQRDMSLPAALTPDTYPHVPQNNKTCPCLYKDHQHLSPTQFIWLWFCHFPKLWKAKQSCGFMAVPLRFEVNMRAPWRKVTESTWGPALRIGLQFSWNHSIVSLVVEHWFLSVRALGWKDDHNKVLNSPFSHYS